MKDNKPTTIKEIIQWLIDNSKSVQHKSYSLNAVGFMFKIMDGTADNFIMLHNAHNLEEFFNFNNPNPSEDVINQFDKHDIILYKINGKEVINQIPEGFSNGSSYLSWTTINK